MDHHIRLISLSLLFFLSSCSFNSLLIRNLDYLIVEKVDDSLHLYGEQETQLKKEVHILLVSEKDRVKKLKSVINKDKITEISVSKLYKTLLSNYKEIAYEANKLIAKKISILDQSQFKKFLLSMKEKNEEIEAQIKKRDVKDFIERYEYFVGDLTKNQKLTVQKHIPLLKKFSLERITNRKDLTLKLTKMNQAQLSKASHHIEKVLNDYVDKLIVSPERELFYSQLQNFLASLSIDQINTLEKKRNSLNKLIDSFLKYYI